MAMLAAAAATAAAAAVACTSSASVATATIFVPCSLRIRLFLSRVPSHGSHRCLFDIVRNNNTAAKMTSTSTTATSDSAIKLAKKKLRSEIGTKLGQLSSAEIDRQSQLLHQNLYVLPEFQRAKRVGLYLSLPLEIDTLRILAHCFELGKKCFVPKYWPKSRRMDFVELYSMQDYEDLPLEPKWQIKQPDPADESRAEALSTGGMDILLVPGVAFTREGLRLGHGMGYFDTWLARCFRTPDIVHPVTVALSLHQQIVTDLPVTDFDVRIDRILTP